MSAGPFLTDAWYQNDRGDIMPCQIQPETAALVIGTTTNTIPAGPADLPISARMNGKANRFSIRARYVRLAWTGAQPTGYKAGGQVRVPVLTPAAYDAYRLAGRGATGTYLGSGVRIVGFKAENDGID